MKYHERIDRYEEWFTTSLLQDDEGECVGVIARNIRDGELEIFTGQERHPRHRRRRPGLQAHHQRAHLHRRRDRPGLPDRARR